LAIANVLETHQGLVDLHVSGHVASIVGVVAIARAVAGSPRLLRLSIGERTLDVQKLRGSDGSKSLEIDGVAHGPTGEVGRPRQRLDDLLVTSALLGANTRLQRLGLTNCSLSGRHAAAALENILKDCTALTSLDISRNPWREGLPALFEAMPRIARSLLELDVSQSSPGLYAIAAAADMLLLATPNPGDPGEGAMGIATGPVPPIQRLILPYEPLVARRSPVEMPVVPAVTSDTPTADGEVVAGLIDARDALLSLARAALSSSTLLEIQLGHDGPLLPVRSWRPGSHASVAFENKRFRATDATLLAFMAGSGGGAFGLTFKMCELGDGGCADLSDSLRAPHVALQRLVLSDGKLGARALAVIAASLLPNSPALAHLDLSGNSKLGSNGGANLSAFARGLEANHTLTELDISRGGIDLVPSARTAILRGQATNSLSSSTGRLSSLKSGATVQKLKVDSQSGQSGHTLSSADIEGLLEALASLGSAVATHPLLTSLSLAGNALGDRGVSSFALALSDEGGGALIALDLSATEVGRAGLKSLEVLVNTCMRISSLELRANGAAFNEAAAA